MAEHLDWETVKRRHGIFHQGHRCPCPAEPLTLHGFTNQAGHRHHCIHEDGVDLGHPLIEHRCECGMTWTEPTSLPAPDTSWIEMESHGSTWDGLRLTVYALVACAVVTVLIFWTAS